MVMLVVLILGVAAVLVTSLNSAGVKIERSVKTSEVLAQARQALIGYAATDDTRPGELPCPDVNNDGLLTITVDYTGGAGSPCTSLVGRLPWKTLGLPDLRDSAGETLWYAVSDTFHAGASPALNSDTVGSISLQDASGSTIQSGVIALLFAPEQILPGQNRSNANVNTASEYLESIVTPNTVFKLDTPNDHQGGSYTYNDMQLAITSDAIFPLVEKVVASHFRNSGVASSYRTAWGALPFASVVDVDYGLLPINGNANKPYWSSISETGDGSATCTVRPSSCAGSSCIYARCNNYTGLSAGDVVVISGTIRNVGMGFWRPYDPVSGTDDTATCAQEVCVRISSTSRYYPANSIMDNVLITYTPLDSNGHTTLTFTGQVRAGYIPNRIQFATGGMPDYSSSLLNGWFAANAWQSVMYYAVSPGYTPTAGNSCNPLSSGTPPYCLTLGSSSDVPALTVMTGRTLAGETRPSANSSDYLEGLNVTNNNCSNTNQADCVFENKLRDNTFNDYAVTLSP